MEPTRRADPSQPPTSDVQKTLHQTSDPPPYFPENGATRTAPFDSPGDPKNPQNWPTWKKFGVVSVIALVAFIVGFGSSIGSVTLSQGSGQFNKSMVVESLATALYLIGLGCGAPFAGPLSEERGRTPVYLVTFALYCCCILGAALAPDVVGYLVFRFLAGACGSTPFTVAAGSMGDIFNHEVRAKVFPFFACMTFLGPMLGPVVGVSVFQSGVDRRWVEWITFILSCFALVLMVFLLPETDPKEILRRKAETLQVDGMDVEPSANVPLKRRLATALARPFTILFTEPIIALLTGYLTLVYSVASCFFSSAGFIFGETYGFDQGSAHLMFISLCVGILACAATTPLSSMQWKREHAEALKQGKAHAGPEAMLWWAMIGGPLLPISVLWMAWSSYSSVS